MRDRALIMILLVLCAGLESVAENVIQKELILGIVFLLGMWQDKVLFSRDEKLLKRMGEIASKL